MKNAFFTCLLMLAVRVGYGQATFSPCAGKIRTVFVIEGMGCDDMPDIISWLDSCHAENGILLLFNVPDTAHCGNFFDQLSQRNIDTVHYNYLPPSHAVAQFRPDSILFKGKWVLIKELSQKHVPPSSNFIGVVDGMVSRETIYSGGVHNSNLTAPSPSRNKVVPDSTLYLGDNGDINLSGLKYVSSFKKLAAKYGFFKFPDAQALLHGGDILRVENHLILGRSSLIKFSTAPLYDTIEAERNIRSTYNLDAKVKIHFLLTDDPSLYHLDLFLTYAGINSYGKMQFFVGYVGNPQGGFGETQRKSMERALQIVHAKADGLLTNLFKNRYMLDSVPLYRGVTLVSGLNGLTGCENGSAVYYFPYPDMTSMADHIDDTAAIRRISDLAFRIISSKVASRKVLVSTSLMSTSGQALHCSMSVLRRKYD